MRRSRTQKPLFYCCRAQDCSNVARSIEEHLEHVIETARAKSTHPKRPHVRGLDWRSERKRDTQLLKRQYRRVAREVAAASAELMSFRAWVRYISAGSGEWARRAREWAARKGMVLESRRRVAS